MTDQGWIKLHRKILEWEWLDEPITFWVFFKCLLLANHESKDWHGITIEKGSFVTSYDHLASKKAKVSVMQVRTALNKLKVTGEITIKTTNKYSVISICNWELYQADNKQDNKQITNKEQTNNKQITTTKNDKNEKNGIYIKENIIKEKSLFDEKDERIEKAKRLIETFNKKSGHTYRLTDGLKSKIYTRLKNYSVEDLETAIAEMFKLPFYRGENQRRWEADPSYLFKSDDNVEKFVAKTKPLKIVRLADIIK